MSWAPLLNIIIVIVSINININANINIITIVIIIIIIEDCTLRMYLELCNSNLLVKVVTLPV